MHIEFNQNEKITLEFSLIENKVNTESRIRHYTDKLNGSNNIAADFEINDISIIYRIKSVK